MHNIVDLRLRVRGLQQHVSWPCIGERWVPCRDFDACKRTHNQYETSCGVRPHPWECLYASGSIISSLSI